MKRVDLGDGNYAIIDDDCEYINDHKWFTGSHVYAVRTDNDTKERIRMHRRLLDFPDSLFVDHINGDVRDNRMCNIRACASPNRKVKGFSV